MSSLVVLVLPFFTVVILLGIVFIAIPRRRKLVAINEREFPHLARLRGMNTVARVIGLVAGLVVIVFLMVLLPHGLGVFLAPAVFAATQILAIAGAGMLTRDTARTHGISGLEVRRIRPYLPMGLTRLIAATTALVGLALIWTTAVAVPDDNGIAGRQVEYSFRCNLEAGIQYDGVCTRGHSPWPGSFYSVPASIALGVVIVLAVVAIIVTVRRPRNASEKEIVRVDDLVRARAVETVIAAVGVASAATLLGTSLLVSTFLANPSNFVPLNLRIAGWAAMALTLVAVATSVWCVVLLLLPGTTAPMRRSVDVAAPSMEVRS